MTRFPAVRLDVTLPFALRHLAEQDAAVHPESAVFQKVNARIAYSQSLNPLISLDNLNRAIRAAAGEGATCSRRPTEQM